MFFKNTLLAVLLMFSLSTQVIGATDDHSSPVTADVDGDSDLDLTDLITILQVVAGIEVANIRSDYATAGVDVTGDNTIGQEEAIYAMQQLQSSLVVSNGALRFTSALKEGATFTLGAEAATDFGTAATIYGYTDFRDQTLGSPWDLGLEIGTARTDSEDGGIVYPGRGPVSKALDSTDTRIKINLPDVTEIFISRALKIRQGGTWPGGTWPNGEPEPGVFSTDSTFKMSWLFAHDDDSTTLTNNLCAPTHVGDNKLSIAGNSHNFNGTGADLNAVSHSGWSVVESWLRADPTNVVSDQADGYIGVYSDQANSIRKQMKGTVFHPDKVGRSFVSVYVKGWLRQNGHEAVSYTDLYIASGPQRVVLTDHHDLYVASKYVIQPHASWSGNKITGKLRLAELDPTTDPIYLHLFDTDNNPVSAPLALVNEIILPTGSSHNLGFDDPTSSIYIRNFLYINQDSYQAQTGEMIRDMSLWIPGNSGRRVVFAIYENSSDDLGTATKIYESTREPASLVDRPDLPSFGAKKVSVLPLLPLTAGKYYWLACKIGNSYIMKSAGTGAQVLQGTGDGDLPNDMSVSELTITEQTYKIGLSATVLD